MNNIKNYAELGGDKWVIGGTLEIGEQGQLTFKGKSLAPATHQADSTASTIAELKADFNALLAKLQTSGLMDKAHG